MRRSQQILPILTSIALAFFLSPSLHAQGAVSEKIEPPAASTTTAPSGPSRETLEKRIESLEAQLELMHEELLRIKAEAALNTPPPTALPATPAVAVKQDKPAPGPRPGFDLGPVHVVPYGTI